MRAAYEAAGAEIVTVAIRRLDLDDPTKKTMLDEIDWSRYTVLPNTAGCYTVEDALRTARLGRELTGSNWVKLEVIGDPKYLWPDPIGTLEAARKLVDEGFVVLPYTTDDPILAKKLEEAGCATVMPLGSAIGSGQGIGGSAGSRSSSSRPACRSSWMPGSASRPTRRLRWSSAPMPAWSTPPSPRRATRP
jgi:thiazole synthase